MKKILLLFILLISIIKGDILIIMNNKDAYSSVIKRFSSLFKNEKMVIAPVNRFQQINLNPRIVFCFEQDAINKFPDNFSNIPVVLFYIKDPLMALGLNMTGILYVPPPSVFFSMINSIGLSGKKVVTIIPEGGTNTSYIESAIRVAKIFNIDLEIIEAKPGGIFEVSEDIKKGELIWIFPNEITLSPGFLRYIVRFSLNEKKPLIGYSRSMVEQGFILAVEVDESAYKDKMGKFLKSIREGRNPLTIPLQYPDDFNYYYNPKVARLLNFKIDFSKFYKEVKRITK